MPTDIDLEELRCLIDAGAQLIEVLPEAEYLDEHLPGALNMPLKRLTRASAEMLDRAKPVVLYCWDAL